MDQANKTLLHGSDLLRKMSKIILFMSLGLFPKMGVCLEKVFIELVLVKLNRILKRSFAL